MIVPSGLPAWARSVSHVHYGGHTSKENYLSRGGIDATTDVDAEEWCRAASDLAANVRTSPFAIITYTCSDSSPAAPTITSCRLMTGVTSTSYVGDSAPAGFPTAARNGNGDVTFTFASSYDDEYSVSQSFAPVHAKGQLHGSTAGNAPTVVSGQTVRVRAFNSGGAAISDATVTLIVS